MVYGKSLCDFCCSICCRDFCGDTFISILFWHLGVYIFAGCSSKQLSLGIFILKMRSLSLSLYGVHSAWQELKVSYMPTTSVLGQPYIAEAKRRSKAHTDELFRNYFVVLNRLLQFEAAIATQPHEGVTRKIRFLAVDIMRRTLREEDWQSRWNETVTQLSNLGLFPIPSASYSWKYQLFSLLSQSRVGRQLLKATERLS